MTANIKEITAQLKELSAVLNSFKSEAVQLRLVELIFGSAAFKQKDGGDHNDASDNAAPVAPSSPTVKRRKRRASASARASTSVSGKDDAIRVKTRRPGRPGGVGLLTDLISKGFFKAPKTIADIVSHCDRDLATKYKPNELSGPLGRLVRSQALSRQKNGDNLYEYVSR